ncbi:MAG: hypothetical protein ACR2J1_06620 [Methyloceanibacter sp.]|uniref:hypothetical protein n=1 Tax=Methyloceanibacter sp. TaxID=1965321 RepID=UPI003D9B8D6D
MAGLHSGVFRFTMILTLIGGLLLPSSARAEGGDTPQRESASSLDAFIADLKVQARRAALAAETAGVHSEEALSALKNRVATKASAFREALSGRQWKWESFRHDSAQIEAWSSATQKWLQDLQRSAKAAFATLGGRTQAEHQSTCPEIHV